MSERECAGCGLAWIRQHTEENECPRCAEAARVAALEAENARLKAEVETANKQAELAWRKYDEEATKPLWKAMDLEAENARLKEERSFAHCPRDNDAECVAVHAENAALRKKLDEATRLLRRKTAHHASRNCGCAICGFLSFGPALPAPDAAKGPSRDCPDCGEGVVFDEDGCCVQCGADTVFVPAKGEQATAPPKCEMPECGDQGPTVTYVSRTGGPDGYFCADCLKNIDENGKEPQQW